MKKNKKRKESYNVLFIPYTDEKPFQLTISKFILKTLFISILVITSLTIIASMYYYTVHQENKQLKKVERQYSELKEDVFAIAKDISTIDKILERNSQLESKLKMVAGIQNNDKDDYSDALGGPVEDVNLVMFNKILENSDKELVNNLKRTLGYMLNETKQQNSSLNYLQDFFSEQKSLLDATPSIWPTQGWLTSSFGKRRDPFTGRISKHKGIDISAWVGQPICATADGIVTYRGRRGGYGLVVVIDHGYGYSTKYAHCSKLLVRTGQKIKRGQRIALLGNTGRSTGPHVHYEVRKNGVPINPMNYIIKTN